MSDAAAQLIQTFCNLPANERYAVLVELAGISEMDNGPISDDELTTAGEQVFAMYDAEEDADGDTTKR